MSKANNSIVIFKNPILEDYFSLPNNPDNSHGGTLTRIKNAWTSFAHVDDTGVLWVDSARLADILRTSNSNANYKIKDIDDSSKKRDGNKLFIRAYEIRKLIDESIQTEGDKKRKEYLRYSEEIYKAMRDCQFVEGIRSIYALQLQENRKTLKKKRIKKYKIRKDELTGESLIKRSAEFSHIRSYSLFKDVADDIENGLIVNKKTHNIITENNINDEKELLDLCLKLNWDTRWHNKFKKYFLTDN